jgi:trk system potassium uptake protein
MLATSLGAKKTVARIDNYEYLLPKHKEFFAKLGVHSLIYPEMLAARDIVDAVKMSWIRQWWEFAGGALVLLGTKMREKAEILNVPLHELGGRNIPFHIVAIKRGNETIIPRGDDVIKLNDIVYFTTTKKYIPYIRKISGKENEADVRNVMIMGGSRIAVRTVQYMPDYMKAKIIESNIARCNRLTELVDDGVMVINGDGRDMQLLMEEGIKNTEAFVALTGNSETNILACLAAKRMGVTKTVAEVENVDYISMAESLDIGTVINKKFIAASHIYQMMLDADVSNVKCLTFANADVAEFTVKPGAKITKQAVKDLGLPKGATIGGLIRNGEVEKLEEVLPVIWDDLAPEAQEVINRQGVVYTDEEGDLVTSIVNGKDCVFTCYDEKGYCYCAIEKAYREGKCNFYKPISCHLYPIRIGDYGPYKAVNYHRWDVCKAAVLLGKKENLPVYKFLKEPLIRKFGAEWYQELENVAKELEAQHLI